MCLANNCRFLRIDHNDGSGKIILVVAGGRLWIFASSSLAQQPMVGPGLLKKFCPFVSVEGDHLPILDFSYYHVLISTLFPSQFWSSDSSYPIWLGVEYFFNGYIIFIRTRCPVHANLLTLIYEGWNFNSGNYLFTTDTK